MKNPEAFEISHNPEKGRLPQRIGRALRLRLAALTLAAAAFPIRDDQPLNIPLEVISQGTGPDSDPFRGGGRIPRPAGYMENPYIGPDGKDYHSLEALEAAREDRFRRDHSYKSSILGREYPVTVEGAEQMRRDETAYWDSQKIDPNRNKYLK